MKLTAAIKAGKDIEDYYGLSPVQEGMLFHVLRDPKASLYFQQAVSTIRGLDVDALENAWRQLIDRHTILRTSFHWEGVDRPVQVVHRNCPFAVEHLDWCAVPASEQKMRMAEFLREDRERGLALGQAPLVRVTVIQTAPNTFYYVRCHHHILLDGWSGPIIFKEYRQFYEAFRRGRKLDLPKIRPYGDYIAWLKRQDMNKAEIYWRETLKGFTAPTPLPEDCSDDHVQLRGGDRFDQRIVNLSKKDTAAIDNIVRKNRITHNILLQGAWALVLSQYSGLHDVCFGALVSGRSPDLKGVEDMVGLFMNTLPVRIKLQEDELLIPWLKKVLSQQIEMSRYEYSPLVQVQGWSEVKSGKPLFDSLVVYENFPREQGSNENPQNQGGNSKASRAGFLSKERTNYPMTIQSAPSQELGLRINFDKARVNPEVAGRALQHLRIVLEGIAANPERTLGEFSMLSEAEKQHILVNWNENQVALSVEDCVHHLFEAQVDKHPDKIALTFEEESLSYQVLDLRANQLAHYLRAQGVDLGAPVALCLERGLDAIIGMLAILKAGCVYLPLEPNDSPERLQFKIGDARPATTLTRENLCERLPKGTPRIFMDRDFDAIVSQSGTRIESNALPTSLAYIIYTACSKGVPKGVQVEHRSITNLVLAQLPLLNIGAGDKVLQLASMSLDVSLGDVFRTLGSGATLCLASQDKLISGPSLTKLLREQTISAITTPASILESLSEEDLPALRALMVVGGELSKEQTERWSRGRGLINSYGNVETTIGATLATNWEASKSPPIGRPLANVEVYILDRHKRIVPVGVTGEIHIGGIGLARGYLNRPDLTDKMFIPNPFSTVNGDRIFCTGEYGHWRSSGQIEMTSHSIQKDGLAENNAEKENADLQQLLVAYCHNGSPVTNTDPDFLRWREKVLPSLDLEENLLYWSKSLEGAVDIELPLDKPRPAIRKQLQGNQEICLRLGLSEKLQKLGQKEDATMFMVVLAAFKILLAKYCGQEDITVGTISENSIQIEPQQMVGFFSNTLTLRTQMDAKASFREAVRCVRKTCLDANAHQNVAFEKIIEMLQLPRDLSRNPLCQISFSLQTQADVSANINAQGCLEGYGAIAEQFDLSLHLAESPEGIQGGLHYNIDLWETATIDRMSGHFTTLLQNAADQPDCPVEELRMMGGQEQYEVLYNWNDTAVDYSENSALLHQLVEAQVERTPDAVALVYEDSSLSYREFNSRANQIAHRLRKMGVGPETLVGVCAERSLELVLALHAILKAGGAYVPLDPTLPSDRLNLMIEDGELSVILTQKHLYEKITGHSNILTLNEDKEELSTEPESNLNVTVKPGNVAYVIYTSGSTGTPKGVMNEHCGICNRLIWMQEKYKLTSADQVLQKTPFTFDVSVWEFFWSFISGASLIVTKPGGHQDPAYLRDIIMEQGVTTMHFVPPMLAVFLEETGVEGCVSLARIICSGEALPLEVQKRFYNKFDTTELHNLYGPTEAAIDVTSWACSRSDKSGVVPIGKPIANMQVYVLDKKLQPVPIGVPGELHLAGVGLARGYLKRPDLTATSFITNPFSNNDEARVYKTGDLCRWLPNGSLDFLGRIDHQVKIRGFRIELGEIESQLSLCANVGQVIVLAQPDATGGKRLVAYVVPDQEQPPAISELKEYLLKKLPEYMVPSAFVFLDEFPLTDNGKINRRALPVPAPEQTNIGEAKEVPQESTEVAIAGIWSETLHLNQIGRNDNFFDLGGHSLLAMTVVSRMREVFNVEVPLRILFDEPTVTALAARINKMILNPNLEIQDEVPLAMTSNDSVVPLSFTQQRMWFIAQLAEASSLNNTSTIIPLSGSFDSDAFEKALTELIRRHATLRTSFDVVEGEPMQFIAPPQAAQYTTIDLRSLPLGRRQDEVKRLQNLEYSTPFDLVSGSAVRFTLVKMGESRQVVLVGIHHIISDGWSLGVLAREITSMYSAFRAGQASPLSELPIQYADYALWQREKLSGGVREKQLAFWKDKLNGAERLELLTDRPRPKLPSYRSAGIPVSIDPELTSKLLNLCHQEEATMFMTLLATFQLTLGLHASQEDVSIGTVVAGRDRPELEQLIGVFINSLVFRTDLSGNPSFRQLLNREKKNCLDVFENMDVPFDVLVEELAPERAMGMQPLFQVLFVLENMPSQTAPGKKKENSQGGGGKNLQVHSVTDVQMFYDITLTLNDFASELGGGLHYNTDLFDASTAESIARHFMALLNQIVEFPDRGIHELDLFAEQERALMLNEWNTTGPTCNRCIHELFEERVDQSPDHIALIFDERKMSYRELDQQANRIANHLCSLGVQAETAVAMYLGRGINAIVALLGILKAGGVYVPLDTGLPPERLTLILDDVQPVVVLTSISLSSSLPSTCQASVVCIDDVENALADTPDTRLPCVKPENLAYIIYTSGSTGRPKGVMIEHRNIVHTILAQTPLFGIDTNSRILQTISLSFDASLGEIFRALIAGSTLCLAHREELLPGPDLMRLLREKEITTVTLSTAALGALPFEELPKLRTLTVGGEALSGGLAALWGKGRRLLNGYGPTEATIGATLATDWDYQHNPPLGRLLPNVRGYVLNQSMQMLPSGVPGELYLGGPGLARGYYNQPELTAKLFVPDPFNASPEERLYRTGDRVRWLPDGQLEFLGRVDEQVKIRGYRIEPGEIATVLRQHENVQDVAVIARADQGDDHKRLVAYVVSTDQDDVSKKAAEHLVEEWEKASTVAASNIVEEEIVDPRLNFKGWNSSYTKEPIPISDMCDWADETITRIRQYAPEDVFEIGCGTGLMLFRLAPFCKNYDGIDLGADLIEITRNHLHLIEDSGCQFDLKHRRADQLDEWSDAQYDCVKMNSVAQYFPDVDYLLDVLKNAVRMTRDGGVVFIGDLRNFKLLEAFHAAVQLGMSSATLSGKDLLKNIQRYVSIERELVVDPSLFARIAAEWPRVTHVRIMPKTGSAYNELNDFRYDVFLEVAGETPVAPDCSWRMWEWPSAKQGLEELRKILEDKPEIIGLKGIPNARTSARSKLVAQLKSTLESNTVAQLREVMSQNDPGVESSELVQLVQEMGYTIDVSWLDCDAEGKFDALLYPAAEAGRFAFPQNPVNITDWQELANNPAAESLGRNTVADLRDHLTKQLPDYMIPSAFVFMKALPLTANGKLDRKALPAPDDEDKRAESTKPYVAPRTVEEKALADIWAVLLRVERVGIHDNFFELGGDSILCIRVIAQANEVGLKLTAQDAYQYQTVEELAAVAGEQPVEPEKKDMPLD